jgi:hypothetical protein
MIKKLLFSLIALLGFMQVNAQNETNFCWSIDYEIWNDNGQPALNIDCGNDDAFNAGDEITMELWVRAYTFAENRKLMGKCVMNDPFDNGYILGFENLHVYAEYFNPTKQEVPRPGDGPMPADSAFVHIVSTYSAITGKIKNYVNGVPFGETSMFPAAPIVGNDRSFGIGNAPWDFMVYQFYGEMDEVRVWDDVRTEEEINQFMFVELKGDEEGLIANYNFNVDEGEMVPDNSANGFTGTMSNYDHISVSIAPSGAPVADVQMQDMTDVAAAFYQNKESYHKITSDQGLSIVSDISELEYQKYVVMGHNNQEGVNSDNAPTDSPEGFECASRQWYLNTAGSVGVNFIFNSDEMAGAGTTLNNTDSEMSHYALLYRESLEDNWVALANPTNPSDDYYMVNGVMAKNGYYTLGHADAAFTIQGHEGLSDRVFNLVEINPNPVINKMGLKYLPENCTIGIYDINGTKHIEDICAGGSKTLELQSLTPGVYVLKLQAQGKHYFEKFIKL